MQPISSGEHGGESTVLAGVWPDHKNSQWHGFS